MIPVAEIGVGEVLLALVPTINIAVIAVIYRATGRTRDQLVGQTQEVNAQVEAAQIAVQTDLRNGIRDRLDRMEAKVDHLVRKEKE